MHFNEARLGNYNIILKYILYQALLFLIPEQRSCFGVKIICTHLRIGSYATEFH